MRLARGLLLLIGVGFGLWGVWLMRDFTSEQLISMGTWLAGGVILHDAIIAPVTVLLGVVGRAPRALAATLGVAAALFPVARIGGLMPVGIASDLLFIAAMGGLGLGLIRGTARPARQDRREAVAAALAGADMGTIRPAQLAIFTPAVPDTIVLNQLQ